MRTIALLLLALCCSCNVANAQEEGYTEAYPPLLQLFDSPPPPMHALEQMKLGCIISVKDDEKQKECTGFVHSLELQVNSISTGIIQFRLTRNLTPHQRYTRRARLSEQFAKLKRTRKELDKRFPTVRRFVRLTPQQST